MLRDVPGIGQARLQKVAGLEEKTCDPSMLNRPEEDEPSGQNAVKLLCGMGMVLQFCRVEATVANGVRRMGKVGEAEPR